MEEYSAILEERDKPKRWLEYFIERKNEIENKKGRNRNEKS